MTQYSPNDSAPWIGLVDIFPFWDDFTSTFCNINYLVFCGRCQATTLNRTEYRKAVSIECKQPKKSHCVASWFVYSLRSLIFFFFTLLFFFFSFLLLLLLFLSNLNFYLLVVFLGLNLIWRIATVKATNLGRIIVVTVAIAIYSKSLWLSHGGKMILDYVLWWHWQSEENQIPKRTESFQMFV